MKHIKKLKLDEGFDYPNFPLPGKRNVSRFDELIDKTIAEIGPSKIGDDGLEIKFHDGSVLDIGYSGYDGAIMLNGKEIKL